MNNLDKETIKGFVSSVLFKHFDNCKKIPKFHEELWDLCCQEHPYVALAAPRGHAKSTAICFSYTLAQVLFRERKFIIICSSTEALAVEHLGNIVNCIRSNAHIKDLFNKGKEFQFMKDTAHDIMVRCYDGYTFRIIAKGSEQKVRGINWRNRRPDLIICDDLEDDEQVMSQERREKFRKWFFNSLLPILSDTGIVRVVGTILHFDSLLSRLLKNKLWLSKLYRAHNEDFSNILWEEQFPKERLVQIRLGYVEDGNPEGYAQEYLNNPIDEETAYFKVKDFKEMIEGIDQTKPREFYIAVDLAISLKQRADYSCFAVASVDQNGFLQFEHIIRERIDSLSIINTFFDLNKIYKPEAFIVEEENIAKALGSIINDEMLKRGEFFNIIRERPTKDKVQRARALQARMRAGGVKFNTNAPWFPDLQQEFLRFPKGAHDDMVDACSWIGLVLDKIVESRSLEELDEEEFEENMSLYYNQSFNNSGGKSIWTGY